MFEGVVIIGRREQEASGAAVEPDHIREHAQKGGPQQVAPLGEDGVDGGAPPFHTGGLIGDAEAHLAVLPGHPETLEQPGERRIVAVVEDDEAGVDVLDAVGQFYPHRVGVPPRTGRGLEDGDLVARMQQMGAHQSGDTGPDDRDLHISSDSF